MVRWSLGSLLVREVEVAQKVYKKSARARTRFVGLLQRQIATQKRREKRPGNQNLRDAVTAFILSIGSLFGDAWNESYA